MLETETDTLGVHSTSAERYDLRFCSWRVQGDEGILSTGEIGRTQLSGEERVGEVGFLV